MYTTDWHGQVLNHAIQEQPSLVLSCYSYGWLMQKRSGDEVTEFAVDPEKIALALAAQVTFDTGLLSGDTLLVRQEGIHKIVVEFRRAQKTGLFVEDSEPIRVPLPPLVLIRKSSDDASPSYQLYAVKKRPTTPDEPLSHAPLPNVFASGSICWGTVQTVSQEAMQGTSLAEDWSRLLGTPFNSHGVSGKSKQYRSDIREMFAALEQRKARVYPKRDLLPANKTLGQVIA